LLELLMVIAVLGIFIGMVAQRDEPGSYGQLSAAAAVLASDLQYGRSLAVANNDTYRFTFDCPNNRYLLQYSGANGALNTLPSTLYRSAGSTASQCVVSLADLPRAGAPVRLTAAALSGNSLSQTTTLEFQPLGGTTASANTVIYLAGGRSPNVRYITVSVDAVTGLATIGPYTSNGPPGSFTLPSY
jgi:Tfp pilus assembly protein FimT